MELTIKFYVTLKFSVGAVAKIPGILVLTSDLDDPRCAGRLLTGGGFCRSGLLGVIGLLFLLRCFSSFFAVEWQMSLLEPLRIVPKVTSNITVLLF